MQYGTCFQNKLALFLYKKGIYSPVPADHDIPSPQPEEPKKKKEKSFRNGRRRKEEGEEILF